MPEGSDEEPEPAGPAGPAAQWAKSSKIVHLSKKY